MLVCSQPSHCVGSVKELPFGNSSLTFAVDSLRLRSNPWSFYFLPSYSMPRAPPTTKRNRHLFYPFPFNAMTDPRVAHFRHFVKVLDSALYPEERRSCCCGALTTEVNDFEICTHCLNICSVEVW